ncbi:30S ribosomal protein S1 [Acetivibrio ethanolgignens]|nr:S1 RNA-binding domain-containing protein [Acetivibrio ethanolgignens]
MSDAVMPSMAEFEEEISRSMKKIKEGDILSGTVIGVSDTEVMLDLGSYTEGIIRLEQLSNDPRFSIKADIAVGDVIKAMVLREDDGQGNILLSKKQADDILAWDKLKELLEAKEVVSVKLQSAVNSGMIAYLEGIRAFVPASQLSLSYVEDLESWVGKTIDVIVITVDEDKKRLVLSARELLWQREQEEKQQRLNSLQKGLVTTGVIEKIAPYGCFVNIGEGLTGLVHISQICGKRIQSPNEVVKLGEEVKVKIVDVKDGKISLSIKAVEEREEVVEEIEKAPVEYHSEGEASTGLASLLAGIKLN